MNMQGVQQAFDRHPGPDPGSTSRAAVDAQSREDSKAKWPARRPSAKNSLMLHTRALNGTIEIDADDYLWDLRREPQWCTADGFQGMLIAVRRSGAEGREALVQFPRPARPTLRARAYRHRPQLHRADLERAIRTALAQGWDPDARGKPFHVEA